MALQVWLPLNGDLNNLGLDDITITNQSISGFTDSGKIGKALTLLNSYYYMRIPTLTNATVFSCAFWYKKNANSSYTVNWKRIVAFETQREGESNGLFRFESSYANTNYDVSVHSNAAYQVCPSGTGNRSLVSNSNDWHHIAMAVNGETISFYVDGNMVNTGNQTTGSLTGLVSICQTNSQADGWLNDLRIYDHALSQKEVKLLSQGLVAHYPLNDGIGGENLIANSWEMQSQVINGYGLADYSFTEHLVSGEKYTITTRLQMSEDKKCFMCYHSGGSYNMGGSWIKRTEEDAIYSYTFTATDAMASQTSKLGYGYLRIYVSNNNGIQGSTPITGSAYCHWIKIEKGEKSTPWVPNKQDALYSKIGLNENIVYDCSGYEHNGQKMATGISYSGDTPRYSCSTDFEASGTSKAYIIAGTGGKVSDEITVSVWVYQDTWSSDPHPISCTEGGGWNIENQSGMPSFPVYIDGVGYKYPHQADVTPKWTDLTSGWHLFTGTYDGFTIKLYIDGELVGSNTATTTRKPIHYHASNPIVLHSEATSVAGSGSYPACKMSDVRIYATALSAEDIADLYKTTASIDDNSNVYGYELQEINKVPYRQLINLDGVKLIGSYSGTLSKESDGVHLDGQVWATDSYANNGREGCVDVDPDNNHYLLSWTFSNTVGNRFYIGIERFDNNYTSTSNSSCIYPVNTQNATMRLSSAQFVDISKDANNNPVKHIKLRILNKWTGSSEDTVGSVIIHKLTLIEIPKN